MPPTGTLVATEAATVIALTRRRARCPIRGPEEPKPTRYLDRARSHRGYVARPATRTWPMRAATQHCRPVRSLEPVSSSPVYADGNE